MVQDARANSLGAYLRARRGLVSPERAGLPGGGNRRVPGLRREEVAMLAGVSTDYYLRLERGRDHHPSAQVLDALARVLQLDDVEREHLHGLAQPRPARRRSRRAPERVPARLHHLLESVGVPAFSWWPSGPSSRMFWPNSRSRRIAMKRWLRKMQMSRAPIPAMRTSPISRPAPGRRPPGRRRARP